MTHAKKIVNLRIIFFDANTFNPFPAISWIDKNLSCSDFEKVCYYDSYDIGCSAIAPFLLPGVFSSRNLFRMFLFSRSWPHKAVSLPFNYSYLTNASDFLKKSLPLFCEGYFVHFQSKNLHISLMSSAFVTSYKIILTA